MSLFNAEILNLGHRGASAYAPENTLAAFRKAAELGADGFECDVQLSKDGVPVIMHDYRLERTTTGAGFVLEKTLAELKQLDAGSWLSDDFGGEPIPTLEETLAFASGKMLLNIELKSSSEPRALVDQVATRVRQFDMLDQCLITSFDEKAILLLHEHFPDITTGLLCDKISPRIFNGGWSYLALRHDLVSAAIKNQIEAAGKKILAWTVNREQDMAALCGLGVGRIITNYPDKYKKLLKN